ncbi:hypothetical protein [Kaistia granuli]|uniref:hypothetical protein n=1 Tax=Kaistia granuli TaxID=363259 RepID=UPI0012EC9025|nr:hypothetical protein [Kaistia granuli]
MSLGVGVFAASGGAASEPPSVAFGGSNFITNSNSSFDVTLNNLGGNDASRRVHIALTWKASLGNPTITVGGTTATLAGTRDQGAIRAGIFTAPAPTGTSVAANLNFGGNTGVVPIAWWISRFLASSAATSFGSAANANNLSTSLNVAAGGIIVAYYQVAYGVSPGTVVWSGATQNFNVDYSVQQRRSGASATLVNANDSRSVAVSFNYNSSVLVAAAFR